MISSLRSLFYRSGIIKSTSLPAFTLSVGNISMGGTGKSPFTSFLARYFLARGISTALLTRGYGRTSKIPVVLAPAMPLPNADVIGDEPWMIRDANPELALVVHAERANIAKSAWQKIGAPKLALLDDGFQHWRAVRDLDILLIDACEGLQAAVPFGRFRESRLAIRRADLIVITRANEVSRESLKSLRKEIQATLDQGKLQMPWKRLEFNFPPVEILECSYEFLAFKDVLTKAIISKESLASVILATGIAKPQSFLNLIHAQGIRPQSKLVLPDHGKLKPENEAEILQKMHSSTDLKVLVTEKDYARWRDFFVREKIPAIYAEVVLRFSQEDEARLAKILEKVSQCITSP